MKNSCADLTFGINRQALAVGQYLAGMAPDFADYEKGFYDVCIETAPWYNCRERGILVMMYNGKAKTPPKQLNIAIFEHRNSDEICAVKWESNLTLNPPTINDVPEKAYPDKWSVSTSFSYGKVAEMATWTYDTMAEFYTSQKPTP